jgi:hypothetical protein
LETNSWLANYWIKTTASSAAKYLSALTSVEFCWCRNVEMLLHACPVKVTAIDSPLILSAVKDAEYDPKKLRELNASYTRMILIILVAD